MWFERLTFGQLVDQAADRWGDREALRFEGLRWSFAEFRDETNRAAKALIAAGVEPGDHVCLWLVNLPEYLFLSYAVSKIGAVLVPINTRFRTRDMAYIVGQSDATTLICANRSGPIDYLAMVEELLPGLRQQAAGALAIPTVPALRRVILLGEELSPGTLDWAAMLRDGERVPDLEVHSRRDATDPDGTAFIMYTSGTTGFPKGVMQRYNVLRNVLDLANRLGMTPNDGVLNYWPLFHVYGFWLALLSTATGSRQVLMGAFDPGEALRLIEAERLTMVHGLDTTHFKELLEHPSRDARDLSSLRTGTLPAGMRSTESIARRAQELLRTITVFGMTEVGLGATVSYLDSDLEVRTTMSGWPQNGYEIKVIDPASGVTQPYVELGEICIRGYAVMQGYYNKPEETAKAIDADGWLHSGDLGYLRADGCLRFLGRYKDMLRVGGENVDPMEVEAFMLEDPRINHAAVVGLPDARLAEVPVAFIIPRDGVELSEEEVVARCRGQFASFKIPRHVFVVDQFPMTGSGKVQKFLLREEAERRSGATRSSFEARPPVARVEA